MSLGESRWIMEKYFVDSLGNPDPQRATDVVDFPYSRRSRFADELREAAARVCGLRHTTVSDSSTETVFLGWSREVVNKAAEDHGRQAKTETRHKKYLADCMKPDAGFCPPSLVGQYIVKCEEIERYYASDVDGDLTLNIYETSTPDIYQAEFGFGVIEGIMMLGPDPTALDQFCAKQDLDDEEENYDDENYDDEENYEGEEEEEDDEDEDGGSDEKLALGFKRKATTNPRGPPSKKTATEPGSGRVSRYFVRQKARSTGTGEIYPDAEKGTIRFKGPNLASLTGKVDMVIGDGIIFTACKISPVPPESRDLWINYSDAAYSRACRARWH